MPSISASQARLMAAVAHGWKKPGGGGPPVGVERGAAPAQGSRVRQMAQARVLRGQMAGPGSLE